MVNDFLLDVEGKTIFEAQEVAPPKLALPLRENGLLFVISSKTLISLLGIRGLVLLGDLELEAQTDLEFEQPGEANVSYTFFHMVTIFGSEGVLLVKSSIAVGGCSIIASLPSSVKV